MTNPSPGGWRFVGLIFALIAIGATIGAYQWHEPFGYVMAGIFAVAAVWLVKTGGT